jgi:hypothetical protein
LINGLISSVLFILFFALLPKPTKILLQISNKVERLSERLIVSGLENLQEFFTVRFLVYWIFSSILWGLILIKLITELV